MALDTMLVVDGLICTTIVMAAWGACLALTYCLTLYDSKDGNVLKVLTWAKRLEAADLIFSCPFYILLFILAARAAVDLYGNLESRWHGMTLCSYHFQLLYVARMSTHCPIQWIVLRHDPKLRLQMTAHHFLSIICFGCALVSTRMHFWANLDGCCEFTTVFLNFVFAFKWFSPKDDNLYAIPKAVSGVMLWIGFIIFRLVLFPAWLWGFYADITNHPAQTWDRLTMLERYLYVFVNVFLLVISTIWFIPITKGVMKALGYGPKHKEN